MKPFNKILVHVRTDSKNHPALERAVEMARVSRGTLTVVTVVDKLPVYLRLPEYGYPALSDTLVKESRARLAEITAPFRSENVVIKTKVLYGKPFLAIIRQVLRARHDLVMKTADKGGPAKLFGGTDLRLFRKCPCPVWVVKPGRPRRRKTRILAAVDPLSEVNSRRSLNRKILDVAALLAECRGAELHVVHVWYAFGASALAGFEAANAADIEKYESISKQKAHASLGELLASANLAIPSANVHLLKGDPGGMIRDFAARNKPDVIVMGTIVRTGIAGTIIGNVAENVLAQVDSSVLAVKPRGFVSPVKPR